MNINDSNTGTDLQRREATTGEGPIRAYAPATDHWYVVQHRAGLGGRVLDLTMQTLRDEGFEAYRPMFARLKRPYINGKRVSDLRAVYEPLFPGYLFVRRIRAGKTAITSIYGIEGGFMGAVRNPVIEAMRDREEAGFVRFHAAQDLKRHPIKPGDAIDVMDAPVKLLDAVVAEVLPGNRLALLSSFMNGSSRLVVDLAQVVRTRMVQPDIRADKPSNRTRKST